MYPMIMRPVFKDYLWGGDLLVRRYGKETALRPVAESWEVSCFPGCASTVENGSFAGQTLTEVLAAHPEMAGKSTGEFPILIKLIDAKQPLSLQVHPGDAYARRVENQAGKSEMWYIVDCEPGAELIIGFAENLSKDEIARAIGDNTIMDKVRRVPVRPGDCFQIPAGLLHAIGAGILIAEIQQSSNVTYRVYDYNRRDAGGSTRELHIEKAVDVIDCTIGAENRANKPPQRMDGYLATQLTDWEYFTTKLLAIETHAELACDESSFACLLALDGVLTVSWDGGSLELPKGASLFVPAGLGAYRLQGKAKVLLTTV